MKGDMKKASLVDIGKLISISLCMCVCLYVSVTVWPDSFAHPHTIKKRLVHETSVCVVCALVEVSIVLIIYFNMIIPLQLYCP